MLLEKEKQKKHAIDKHIRIQEQHSNEKAKTRHSEPEAEKPHNK